jgi:hypothetical protein
MAKKPRSQRRNKGKNGDVSLDATDGDQPEELPEDHTIAGSVNSVSVWDDDDDDQDNDDLIGHVSERGQLAAASREAKLRETLVGLEEFASEKRTSLRESRLRRLFKGLTQYATGSEAMEIAIACADSIRVACLYSLRAGSASEQYAACRCLEAAAVVFQADQDGWIASLSKQLHRTVQITSRAAVVRASALRAWSLSVLIGSSEMETTHELLSVCEALAQPTFRNASVPGSLRSTALDCWALLATTLPDFSIAGSNDIQQGRGIDLLPLLKECLEDESCADLRSSAGECMSLIHASRLELSDESLENTTKRQFQKGSWDGTEWEVLVDEIRQSLSELAVQSGHHMSKKAKKAQRATFREFVATIVDDEAPEETVALRDQGSLTLTTWKEIIQLSFVRECLQGGFQIQLFTNGTLQIMFGLDGFIAGRSNGLSAVEKRLYMSKASETAKEADLHLTKNRNKREHIKNHFLTVDGDDY